MSGEIPALQAADEGRFELAAIAVALTAEFAVATGSKRRIRRRRVGTLDRRLRAAGLRLEPADVLPGPVRDVVATVTGVGALVVTSDKKRRVQRLELDNQDGKTVA